MTSKERVRAAFTRQCLPDRVPLQFDLSRGLLKKFAVITDVPARVTTAYYEDVTWRISANALRTAMGSDCVIVGASLPREYTHPTDSRGLIVNEFGMGMRQGELYMEVIDYPLAHVSSVREVEEFPFPDPLADGRYDDAISDIERFRDTHFLIGDVEVTVFSMMHQLVGIEKLLMDMATGEEYVEALLEKTEKFAMAVGLKLISLGVEAIWGGDDFGTQTGLLMSPRMWRRYFKPSFEHQPSSHRRAAITAGQGSPQ